MLKQCIICENWFDTKDRGSRAITCSDGCSKKRERKQRQERYQNDPDYRERKRERERKRYQNDLVRERKRRQERYQNDPDYRERELERALKNKREWRSKVKKHGFMKAIEMVKKISKKLSEEEKGES